MKPVLIFPMMFLLLVQTFSQWAILLEYRFNKDYIAQNLCENRDVPGKGCAGKCQLKKKLAAEEGKGQSERAMAKIKFSEAYHLSVRPELGRHSEVITSTPVNSFYQISPYSAPAASIFHPPAVA